MLPPLAMRKFMAVHCTRGCTELVRKLPGGGGREAAAVGWTSGRRLHATVIFIA